MMIKLCENLTRTTTFMYNSCFITRLHLRSFMLSPCREWTTVTWSSPGHLTTYLTSYNVC